MIDILTLSDTGAKTARKLLGSLPQSRLHVHESVADRTDAVSFSSTATLAAKLFPDTEGIVFIGPAGVMVRALSPLIQSKLTDPPVVVLDVLGRWTVSLLSGHEGGANDLALTVANILGSEPVITTTSEAVKDLVVGIGCRRGASREAIVEAVRFALAEAGAREEDVRLLASADIKAKEVGLLTASEKLRIPLRFIPSAEIRACQRKFAETLAKEKVNLPGVAEPAVLLAGRRTTLLLQKIIHNSVTIAIARENSW